MEKISMEKLVNFCKQYGFIYQGSEIYGGLANSWDYGPLGIALKNNIKNAWMKKFVQENNLNVEMDSAILMNPKVWEASGHVGGFNDPLIDCKGCKTRYRADKLIEEVTNNEVDTTTMTQKDLENYITEKNIACPKCGKRDWTEIRQFNMMFQTHQGVFANQDNIVYLRPETAQGIFINFMNVQRTMRLKVPFGIAQAGKSFRNEITPGNFIFRTREFEQIELEFFCKPGTELEWFNYWKNYCKNWLLSLNIKEEHLKLRDHSATELAFYSNATTDIEYLFPNGFGELWGIASRTDYDLKQHMNYSKTNLEYFDPETNEKYVPYVIEPSLGLNRMLLAILAESYNEEPLENGEIREIMHFHPALAPYKCAVLPLVKKYHGEKAMEIYQNLSKYFPVSYDESGTIGKRYRRQDVIGTPYVITVDETTLLENKVTIRDRDTMNQEVISIEDIAKYINDKIVF